MAVDWRGALRYPSSGPERERPVIAIWVLLLLGTVVPLLPFFPALGFAVPVMALVTVIGYVVRALVASEHGDAAPALLTDPLGLLRLGFGGALISLVYLAIPFVLLGVTVYGAIWSSRVPDPDSFSALTIYAGATAVLFLSMVGAYLLPIGLATYGSTGSLRAAFSCRRLRAVVTKAAYFAGWTAATGIFGFVLAIAMLVSSAHRAGPVAATGIIAYIALFTVHVWGRALARAR